MAAAPAIMAIASLAGTAATVAHDSKGAPPDTSSPDQVRPQGAQNVPFPQANVASSLPTSQLHLPSSVGGNQVPSLGSNRDFNLGHLLSALNGGGMQ